MEARESDKRTTGSGAAFGVRGRGAVGESKARALESAGESKARALESAGESRVPSLAGPVAAPRVRMAMLSALTAAQNGQNVASSGMGRWQARQINDISVSLGVP